MKFSRMASIIGALVFILATLSTIRAAHIVGDMILTDDQFKHLPKAQIKIVSQANGTTATDDQEHERQKRNARRDLQYRWTNGVIPFKLDKSFNNFLDLIAVKYAMDVWSNHTCVSFRTAKRNDKNKIFLIDGDECSSNVGMVGGKQEVTLNKDGCRGIPTILHELGHAIGLAHTQSRPDRDKYLKLNLSSVDEENHYNFGKATWKDVHHYGVKYDYYSIMHYGSKDFGDETGSVIKTKDPKFQNIIGEATTLSFGDIEMVNKMYKCKPRSCKLRDSDCPGISFVGAKCQCLCPGPDTFNLVQPCEGGNTGGSEGGNNETTTMQPHETTSRPTSTTFETTSSPMSSTYETKSGPTLTTFETTSSPMSTTFETTSSPMSTTFQTTSSPMSTTFEPSSSPTSTTFETTSNPTSGTFKTTSSPTSTTFVPTSRPTSTTFEITSRLTSTTFETTRKTMSTTYETRSRPTSTTHETTREEWSTSSSNPTYYSSPDNYETYETPWRR